MIWWILKVFHKFVVGRTGVRGAEEEGVPYLKCGNHWRVKGFLSPFSPLPPLCLSLTMMKFRETAAGRLTSLLVAECSPAARGKAACSEYRAVSRRSTPPSPLTLTLTVLLVFVSAPQVRRWCRWRRRTPTTPPMATAPDWCTASCRGSRTSLWSRRLVRISC